jgi:hypothetical protein
MSVDLSGLLYIQKDYLYDLSAIATNQQPVGNYINDLQNHLGKLYSNYSTASLTSQNVLNNQAEIDTIVQTEQDRLMAKKQEIDSHIFSQNRLIELNDSYRKRQEAYLYIIFILVISGIFIILLLKLRKIIPYPMIAEVFLILIVVFDIIYIIKLLWNIYKRDNLNYDNLVFNAPIDASGASSSTTNNNADLLNNAAGSLCIGQTCCSGNTIWNPTTYECDIKCPRPGDLEENTINYNGTCIDPSSCPIGYSISSNFCIPNVESFINGPFEKNSYYADPYSPSEYSNYGKYNKECYGLQK